MQDELTETVIGCAMKVHRTLGPGFLENVYSHALAHELKKTNLNIQLEAPLKVYYDDILVGEYKADILIPNRLIIELKAVSQLTTAHEVQTVNYLTATNIDTGLLLNFGTQSLQVKRKFRSTKRD